MVRESSNGSKIDTNEQAAGMLEEFQDPQKADREQDAWKHALKDKHGTD